MNPERFSPQESLKVIQEMIEKAKNQVSENGHLYLLWGWTVFFCSVGQFILWHFFNWEKNALIWYLCFITGIYQFFYIRKERRKVVVLTYADRILSFVWISFVIVLLLIILLFSLHGETSAWKLITPVLVALYGVPTFVSGIVLQFRPLIFGAITCWALSVGAAITKVPYQLLFPAAAMLVAWIIPGTILRKKYLKAQKHTADHVS
ncbi:MAG: hypothetical protein N2747_00070 [Chitinophagaceae bacterium]|nr:hypothetical protein [Chitinophagaceae bacterium]